MHDFTDADVHRHVHPGTLLPAVGAALRELGHGDAAQAATQHLAGRDGSFFLSLAATLPSRSLAVAKWASFVPGEPGLPGRSTATLLASDVRSGALLATVRGTLATRLRTAASALVVLDAAHPDPRRVCLIGFGHTNRAVLDMLRHSRRHMDDIRVLVRTPDSARRAGEWLHAHDWPSSAVATSRTVLHDVDVAISATGAQEAVVDIDDLASGGLALSLDGPSTWCRRPGTPVFDDRSGPPGTAPPPLSRLVAGTLARPAGRLLADLSGSAVTDAALVGVLLDRHRAEP